MQPDPRELLLNLLKQHQPISVWRLADISKLGIGTVTTIIHPMIKSGEIVEVESRNSVPQYQIASVAAGPVPAEKHEQAQLDL